MTRRIAPLLVESTERFLGDALGRLEIAGHAGLSVSHAFAIQLIGAGVVTITALSDVMRMSPQAVSAIVDQLERRGSVVRTRQPDDARAKILGLTDEGTALASAIERALEEAEAEWTDLVGPERLAELVETLSAYVAREPAPTPVHARRRGRRVRIV